MPIAYRRSRPALTGFHATWVMFDLASAVRIGRDLGSPSPPNYGPRDNEFNGTIAWVQLDAGTDDQDHLISPEEHFNLAMAKQ